MWVVQLDTKVEPLFSVVTACPEAFLLGNTGCCLQLLPSPAAAAQGTSLTGRPLARVGEASTSGELPALGDGATLVLQAVLPGRVSGSGEALCARLWRPALLPRHRAAPPSPPDGAPGHPLLPACAPGKAGSGCGRVGWCFRSEAPGGCPSPHAPNSQSPRPAGFCACRCAKAAGRGALLAQEHPACEWGWSPLCAPHGPPRCQAPPGTGFSSVALWVSVGLRSHQATH